MHRAGTSAITRVVALLGADLPRKLGAAAADNELGFWEPLDIVETHERLLAAAGSSWEDVSPISDQWFATAQALEYEDRLLELLESNYGNSPMFVLKDPRICRLVPLWLRVLERFGAEPSFIISVRNPLEVAASLRLRNGFSTQKSQLLWLRHMLDAERFSRRVPRSFVSYERLLLDWMPVADQIASELGLTWAPLNHNLRVEIDRFLSTAHRHHTVADARLTESTRVLPAVKRLYGLLAAASEPRPSAPWPEHKRTLERMYRELGETDVAYGPLLAEERMTATERVAEVERHAAERVAEVQRHTRQELDRLLGELSLRGQSDAARRRHVQALTAQVARLTADLEALEESERVNAERQSIGAEQERRLKAALSDGEQALVVSAAEVQMLARRLSTLEQGLAQRQAQLAASQAELADQLVARDAASAEKERVLSRKVAERDDMVEHLSAQLAQREQAIESDQRRIRQLAGEVARLEGEHAETEDAVRSLQDASEAAREVQAQLNSELARRAQALASGGVREQALTDQTIRLQAALLDLQGQLDGRARQLEDRERELAAAERRWRDELAVRARELAASDADARARTSEVVRLQSELSLRGRQLESAASELAVIKSQLDDRLGARLQRRAHRLAVAVGTSLSGLASANRRWLVVASWLVHTDTRRLVKVYFGLRRSAAFDPEFYLANYRDVARSGADPLLHYIRYGVRDRYDPNAGFSTAGYLASHPELVASAANPLLHFLGSSATAPALPSGEAVAEKLPEQRGLALPEDTPSTVIEPAVVPLLAVEPSEPASASALLAIPRGAIVVLACEDMGSRPAELAGHRVWQLAYGPVEDDAGAAAEAGAADKLKQAEIEALRARGAGYLVFAGRARAALAKAPWLTDYLEAKYRCLDDSQELAVFELTARRARRRTKRSHRAPGSGGLDVICLPIIDWNYRFQRPQQLMTQFAERGHRVFYVATAFQRDTRRPAITELSDNVWGVRLAGRPEVNIYNDTASDDVIGAAIEGLAALREDARIGPAVVVVDLPFWAPIALESRNRWGWKVIYDCMDEHGGFVVADDGGDELRTRIDIQERALLQGSDLVLVTSKVLEEKVSPTSRKVLRVPNAADFEHFSRTGKGPLPPTLPRPVIGYYGAISSWFDSSMIGYAARENPGWSFVLAGRTTGADLAPIEGLTNVHLLGELSYAAIPALLHQFDVACIPFHLIDLTLATNPVKFYEYMSAGKPVVSVELPELEQYEGYFYPVRSNTDFVAQIDRALAEDSEELRQRRIRLGAENTWTVRYRKLASEIRPWYRKVSVIVTSFNNPEYLRQCLDSLRDKTDYPNFEVIVVDNGSEPELVDEIAARSEHDQHLRLIAQGENVGFARANNIGIEASADADYIVLLNDDTVVTPGWLGRLLGHLEDDSIGLVGPVSNWAGNEARIEVPYADDLKGLDDFAAQRAQERRGELFDIPVLAMYCAATRRSFIDELGRLDERFRIGMFEDDDFAMRVREAGKRVVCAEDVFIHHWGRASFRRMSEAEYDSLFEENKRVYEEIWNRRWVPHTDRKR